MQAARKLWVSWDEIDPCVITSFCSLEAVTSKSNIKKIVLFLIPRHIDMPYNLAIKYF